MKFYYTYDIFGHDRWSAYDFVCDSFPSKASAEKEIEAMAADEWCSYGGLHGIGFGEDEIEEYKEEGLSDKEIEDEEWEQATNSISYIVLTEDEFIAWLKNDGHDNEEIQKILLDLGLEA